jgi:hypothetical protein
LGWQLKRCFQGEIAQEYDVVKNIMQTLAMFKGENHDSRQVGQGLRSSFASFEEPTRDPDVWPAPPPKDPGDETSVLGSLISHNGLLRKSALLFGPVNSCTLKWKMRIPRETHKN